MVLLPSHDTNASATVITWPKRSCCTLHKLSWHRECTGAFSNAISVKWCQWHYMTKIHGAPYINYLDLRDEKVQLTVPSASFVPMVSHDQNSHFAPHFDCLFVRKVVVPLTMLMTPCNVNISANGMTWPERSCCILFQSYWPHKCNGTFDNTICITCCLCQSLWEHITKISCCTSFNPFDIRNWIVSFMMPCISNDTEASANSITWPHCTSFQLWPRE